MKVLWLTFFFFFFKQQYNNNQILSYANVFMSHITDTGEGGVFSSPGKTKARFNNKHVAGSIKLSTGHYFETLSV